MSSMFNLIAITLLVTAAAFKTQLHGIKVNKIANSNFDINTVSKVYSTRLYAEPPKITRNNEEEYFESEFDRKSVKERLPFALGFLGVVSLPFIVGMILITITIIYTNANILSQV